MPTATPSTTRRRKSTTSSTRAATVRTPGTRAKSSKSTKAAEAQILLPVVIPQQPIEEKAVVVLPDKRVTQVRRRVTGLAPTRPVSKTVSSTVAPTPAPAAPPSKPATTVVRRSSMLKPRSEQRTAQALLDLTYGEERGTASNKRKPQPKVVEDDLFSNKPAWHEAPRPTHRPAAPTVEESSDVDEDELRSLQTEFLGGRTEILQEYRELVKRVDAECIELDQRVQTLREVRSEIRAEFERINALDPENWEPQDVIDEMNEALSIIGKSQRVHDSLKAKVDQLIALSTVSIAPEVREAPKQPNALVTFITGLSPQQRVVFGIAALLLAVLLIKVLVF
jgi:hypothetical protein